MPFSLFVLALYVFLQSAPVMGWFSVDPKFTAVVGILFVLVVVFDAAFWARSNHPTWFSRSRPNPNQQ
jgi:hypothetical protein